MGGIGPWHIRMLCENPFEGGRGYTPSEVGAMTLDQIYMLLCDKKMLRKGAKRLVSMGALEAVSKSKDGTMKGRAADGTVFTAKVGGESVASQLIEAENEKRREEAKRERRRKAKG